MSEQFEMEEPERLAVAAIGEPGQRVFLLQASQGQRTLTLKVEKTQVAALVVTLVQILQSFPEAGRELEAPEVEGDLTPDFVVGGIKVQYDDSVGRVVLTLEELVTEDPPPERQAVARIVITRAQAAAVAKEGRRLVEGGRPPCPFCGYPLDQRGHVCPRTNGSHPPLT
jgi:uncharacterized repeat protein (TIGR03847 family)